MRRRIFILLCILWSSYFHCYAQRAADPISALQRAVQNFEEELTREAIEDFLNNPLRINIASLAEMEAFPLFTRFMAVSLFDYIKRNGAVLSIYELSAIPGFNQEIAESLSPFVDLSAERQLTIKNISKILAEGRSQILLRGSFYTKKQEGYLPISKEELEKRPNSRYVGPPGRVYGQYKFEVPGLIKFSATTEKDPGEKIGDYIGFALQAERIACFNRVVAGDFTARFGQGLVLWNAPSLFSSTTTSSLIKQELGLTSFSSTDENRAFRGVGVSAGSKRGVLSILFSSKRVDSRIVEEGFTSLLTTGLHNTITTLERRKNLTLSSAGVNYSYSTDRLKGGVTLAAFKFSHPYAGRDSAQARRQARFGNFGGNAGLDFYAHVGNFRLFGEIASDLAFSPAMLTGIVWKRSYNLDISLAARYYSDDYLSLFGGALSKNGKMRGERRVDAILNYRGNRGANIKGWLSYADGSKALRAGAEISIPLSKSLEMLIKADYREERSALRLQMEWVSGKIFTLVARGEANLAGIKESLSAGWMAYGELIALTPSGNAGASARVAIFNTPVWDNRVYAYERDLLYGFSVPALYGKGVRCYLNMHLRSFKWMDIWLKGALWLYTDRDYTGEGPTRMEGPSSFEIKWEARFRF
jgi:hypothetical protein